MGLGRRLALGAVRLSLGRSTARERITEAVTALAKRRAPLDPNVEARRL